MEKLIRQPLAGLTSTAMNSVMALYVVAQARANAFAEDNRGIVGQSMALIIGGLILVLIAMVLGTTVVAQAVTNGTATGIGSFGGYKSLNDLMPLVWGAIPLFLGIGLVGVGAYKGVKGRG